jgi:hypothetical protein
MTKIRQGILSFIGFSVIGISFGFRISGFGFNTYGLCSDKNSTRLTRSFSVMA